MMYAIVRNVVTPASTSVRTVVPELGQTKEPLEHAGAEEYLTAETL